MVSVSLKDIPFFLKTIKELLQGLSAKQIVALGGTLLGFGLVAYAVYLLALLQSGHEKLEAVKAVDKFAQALTDTGTKCVEMLSIFSRPEFADFTEKRRSNLNSNQQESAQQCFLGIKPPPNPTAKGGLTDDERLHLVNTVVKHLNAYDVLAMHWRFTGQQGKTIICDQLKTAHAPTLLTIESFRTSAKGTPWWQYPNLDLFMSECK